MTLISIGFGLMTVAAVALHIGNRRLIKSLRKATDALKEANGKMKEAHARVTVKLPDDKP